MKNIILVIGSLLTIGNILIGSLLTSYQTFNIILTSSILAITTILLFITQTLKLRDGFNISLIVFFIISLLIEFFLGIISKSSIKNNWIIIVLIGLFIIKVLLLLISYTISKRIQK